MAQKRTAKTAAPASKQPKLHQRYEYRGITSAGGASRKFWEPRVDGKAFVVRFGRIGTNGQERRKSFPTAAKAEGAFLVAVREKLLKGYKPARARFTAMRLPEPSVTATRALASVNVGEHVFAAAFDLAAWLTACIQHGVTLEQFQETWKRFQDGDEDLSFQYDEEEVIATAGGRGVDAGGPRGDDVGDDWSDILDIQDDLSACYAEAVEGGATRFVLYDNNAYIDVVAVRGDPGAQAIEIAVITKENARQEPWPMKLAPGAPISWLGNGQATLRDGTVIRYE